MDLPEKLTCYFGTSAAFWHSDSDLTLSVLATTQSKA